MKRIVLSLLLITLALGAFGQRDLIRSANKLKATEDFDNIHVQKLFSDEKASCFVIWVKEKVRLHKHVHHSETVYILKGKAEMQLGEKSFEVKKGDVIFIPNDTPHGVVVKSGTMKVISVQAPEFKGKDRVFLD